MALQGGRQDDPNVGGALGRARRRVRRVEAGGDAGGRVRRPEASSRGAPRGSPLFDGGLWSEVEEGLRGLVDLARVADDDVAAEDQAHTRVVARRARPGLASPKARSGLLQRVADPGPRRRPQVPEFWLEDGLRRGGGRAVGGVLLRRARRRRHLRRGLRRRRLAHDQGRATTAVLCPRRPQRPRRHPPSHARQAHRAPLVERAGDEAVGRPSGRRRPSTPLRRFHGRRSHRRRIHEAGPNLVPRLVVVGRRHALDVDALARQQRVDLDGE
mmetsp:Transcript_1563/g.3981  ORF Transcript_1563/g.3981 Transcript_1563/m.3981 type:complete len:271 (+) Transcript_1563:287-1099(+)